ncbi:MAG: DUF2975 domain-containing protein [Candidatus Marinimicrobia bacterium]|nr:DUF2975 domain-containing protein [Candidatus Neomarinimicrobiota bacterium]MBL7009891.1 DUF2975 domain-containing protein [Candidatus Neomarinimicrobiota bacterium]MBL7030158.1 DUF2975 domain-containing protein [Candidatus Neomarinimicrobiota bacterium]
MPKILNNKLVAVADVVLRIIWYLSIAGTVFFMGKMLLGPVLGITEYSSGLVTPIEFSVNEQGTATFDSDQTVPVKINHAKGFFKIDRPVPTMLMVVFFLLNLVVSGLILWVIYALWKIVQSVRQKNPFIVKNGRRLRIIAFSMIGIELIQGLANLIKMLYLEPRLNFDTILVQSKIHISFHVIVAGLVILVIAEAFRIGAELKEEQELTI